MASGMADYLKNKLLNLMFNITAYVFPTTVYIALYTAAPTSAGGGTEVTGGSYARVAITCDTTNFPVTSTGEMANAVALNFAQATAPWGTVVAWAMKDASSAGNFLFYGAINPNKTIGTGDILSIGIGVLKIKFNNTP